ncbi:hypothetical protein [Massilia soli]|uniref:Uncharacterized protein n=1 Tax=Massilia soli TaxID=2792854 RepID=A0ABS7SNA6_9BURK|nr:hypothetical protein [Massilia soli]MBZ2207670.1 hypothetical protein [Massilia soli]
MRNIKFSNLDPTTKHAVFWLADEAETLTAVVTAAAYHIGEIFEAAAFLKEFPKGTEAHTALAERLRLGGTSGESILDCIKRVVPVYLCLGESTDAALDELLVELKNRSAAS